MSAESTKSKISRREMLGTMAATVALAPALRSAILSCGTKPQQADLHGIAGADRIVVLPGKTYLRGWAGYGNPPGPRRGPGRRQPPEPQPTGPAFATRWSMESGPGQVAFADPETLITTAEFSRPGAYVIKLTAENGRTTAASILHVTVEASPPAQPLDAVYTKRFKLNSPLWNARAKAIMVNWIPYCIDQMNRTDLFLGNGGIDNFAEAGKALRGLPHRNHQGRLFSDAWVHQTVESMCIALMIDAQGDSEIIKAQTKMRATLEDWIPKILSAQEPDGYLDTAFTLDQDPRPPQPESDPVIRSSKFEHWDPAHRRDHEGYVAGYFLESAINHYLMTGKKDARLYDAAKKLADCWDDHLGPAPKKAWWDGHQGMEQALVRLGRFVNDMEGRGKGDRYIKLAKFLLDCRYNTGDVAERQEGHQAHVPVIEQYEAVGHAVRAAYTYTAMADVAMETQDPGYRSAVKSLWDNIVNRKYYLTGGIGSAEFGGEAFGSNYNLRQNAYCESCSTCGIIFFFWKMHLTTHEARHADLYEESIYNALLGSLDLEARNFYYQNPLDAPGARYPWNSCPCCVGNIPRTLLMLPTWSYSKSADSLYVNMYVGSTMTVENVAGTDVEMVQDTNYPWDGKVIITVNPTVAKRFSVRLRVPDRNVSTLYRNQPAVGGLVALAVNGFALEPAMEKGYAVISREWKPGDRIELVLPLVPQRVNAIDQVEDCRNKVALRYGPVIYNIEKFDQDIDKALGPAALSSEWRGDLLGGVMVIKGQFADGGPMLAIPNFARTNREPGGAEPTPGSPGSPERDAVRPIVSRVWMKKG
ncbi:MAG: glycoside hydrolase family 127 protein [Candidatus Aminicenantales bacterium]